LTSEEGGFLFEPEVLQFLYQFAPIRPGLATDPDAWKEEEVRIGQAHYAYLKQATQDRIVLLSDRSREGVG
jgi:hypothetical protein